MHLPTFNDILTGFLFLSGFKYKDRTDLEKQLCIKLLAKVRQRHQRLLRDLYDYLQI